MIALDKTGTVTEGEPRVTDVVPLGRSREELLRALEQLPQDLAYSDTASAIYRILAAMDVPTKIIR